MTMLKTNQAYINEFSFFDNVMECVEECRNEVDMAVYSYNNNKRQAELKSFFEGVMDDELFIEKEGEGVLAKIGNVIIKLVKKVADFLTSTKEKLLGLTQKSKTDAEIVNKLIAEHPELRKEVIDGLEKEWFTYKDVAKFEKDVVGLIQMLDKNKIDHATFKDKMKKACKEFSESGKSVLAATATLGSILMIIPNIAKGVKASRATLQEMSKTAENIKKNAETNYTENDVNKFQAITNAIGQVIGLTTKECNVRERGQGKIASILNKFANSKVGTKLKMDDTSRENRHQNAKDKADDRNERNMKRDVDRANKKEAQQNRKDEYEHRKYNDAYYQRMEDKMRREKEHQNKMNAIRNNVNNTI